MKFFSVLFAFFSFLFSMMAKAADYSGITDAVSFTEVIAAMIAIAGITAGAVVVWKGIGWVIGAIKRG